MSRKPAVADFMAVRVAPHSHLIVLIGVLLMLVTSSRLEAQEREGLFVGVGLGWGSLDITCDGCEVDRESGFSGNFRIGGAVSDHVLIGAESEGWYKSVEGTSISFGTLTASAYVYPAAKGLYLRGGIGLAVLSASDGGFSDSDTGLGFSFGAGYDIPIARKTALTPYANWMFGNFEGGGSNVIQLGLAVSFY
jgi:hypothetical protein